MAKHLTESQRLELAALRRASLVILDFLASRGLEARQVGEMRRIVETEYSQQQLSRMRVLRSDLNEWLRDYPRSDQDEVRALLVASGSDDPEEVRANELRVIQEVVRRGRIRSEEECALLRGRLDELFVDARESEEVARLNALLAAYARE